MQQIKQKQEKVRFIRKKKYSNFELILVHEDVSNKGYDAVAYDIIWASILKDRAFRGTMNVYCRDTGKVEQLSYYWIVLIHGTLETFNFRYLKNAKKFVIDYIQKKWE